MKQKKIRVLFVCTHNSGRSRMAEAFLNELGSGRFEAESAGLEPREINPYVFEVMKQVGIDLAGSDAHSIFEYFKEGRLYTHVIYVCGMDTETQCPIFPGIRTTFHWPFPDPAGFTGTDEEILDQTRRLRDEIKARVESYINEIPGGKE